MINRIQKKTIYLTYYMCVHCVYLLCINKYKHMHVYIVRKICYVYMLNIFMYNIK